MSRTLTPALLAAARSFKSRPAITLDIADMRLHWSALIAGTGALQLCSQVVDDTAIHRIRTSGTNVQVAKVTDPATASEWTTWTTLASNVVSGSDCAIARYAANSLRAFFLSSVGGTPNIRDKESTDSGATWSAYSAVVTPAASTLMFAAAHQRVFYASGAGIATKSKAGGAWSAEVAWSSYPGHTALYGIAACYNEDDTYALLVCYDGYVVWTLYREASGWDAPFQLVPGWNGLPDAGAAPSYPHIIKYGSTWLASYLDAYAGSPAWSQPVVFTTNGRDIGNVTALDLHASTHKRTALSYVASTKAVYAANTNDVLAARAYAADDEAQNLSGLRVLAYQRKTSAYASSLQAEVWDPDGELKSFAQDGQAASALRPLAVARMLRGYYLDGVAAQVALDPHYITRIEYQWGEGRGRCSIEAVDGWGLLALWHPDTLLTYANRSVIDLLNHLLARVGLRADADGSDGVTYTVPLFSVTPATSGLDVVRSLLELGGLAGYWQADGDLYVLKLDAWAPSALPVGPDELRTAHFCTQTPEANSIRVYGQDAALDQVGGACTDAGGAQWLGLSLVATRFDKRLTSPDQAALSALGQAERAARHARHVQVTVPLRPDVECWDRVSLSSDPTLLPPSDKVRRVSGIVEAYDCERGVCRTQLELTSNAGS